jgi:YbbR domain-containing protein
MAIVGFRHIGLKILAIALAALLWLVVAGEQIVDRALRIPLEFTNLPSQLEIVGEPPNVVDVRVRGSSGALSRIAAGELVAVLDLRGARPGPRIFHLGGSDVRAPFGVEVVQVAPSNLSIAFERSASKVLPIVPEVEGEPAPGFEIGTVTADPPTVEVVGPASVLDGLTSAMTEPVSAAGASGPVTESVGVGVTHPAARLRVPDPVRVTVTIVPAQHRWAVAGVPVTVVNGSGAVTVTPAVVTIHVFGPRDSMAADAGAFDVSVDVGGLRPGEYEIPVRVALPPRVGVTRIDPADVRVRIR